MSNADPERVVKLLWRSRRSDSARRGPVSALTTDRVVDAAVALADAEGFEAVTIRRLGKQLGTPPMTLYTHIESRAVLAELMLDSVYSRMNREVSTPTRWQDRLWSIARDNRRLHARHPWIIDIASPRTVLGPGALGKYEYELGALQGSGLNDLQTDAALTLLLGIVDHCARLDRAKARAETESGVSDPEWWEKVGPILAAAYDSEEFPLATRIGTAAGEQYGGSANADYAFEFGVTGVIATIQAAVQPDE